MLLDLLQNGANIFNICRKHTMVYLVQLPPRLPHHILIEMVNKFEGYLLKNLLAIKEMMDSTHRCLAITHSLTLSMDSIESDAAMSSSSGESVAPHHCGFPIATRFKRMESWTGHW